MQRTEPELERSATEQLAKESGPASGTAKLTTERSHTPLTRHGAFVPRAQARPAVRYCPPAYQWIQLLPAPVQPPLPSMLTEYVVFILTPAPFVLVNCYMGFRWIVVRIVGVPADAHVVAHNISGRAHY